MYRDHTAGDHVPSSQGWGSCTEPTRLGIMYRAHKAGYHVPSPQGWVSCAEPTTLKNRRRTEENRRKPEPRRTGQNRSWLLLTTKPHRAFHGVEGTSNRGAPRLMPPGGPCIAASTSFKVQKEKALSAVVDTMFWIVRAVQRCFTFACVCFCCAFA